jgi:hypothetical protein
MGYTLVAWQVLQATKLRWSDPIKRGDVVSTPDAATKRSSLSAI